jgi:hypothetical protein
MMDLSKYIKSGKINESKAKNILKQILAGNFICEYRL